MGIAESTVKRKVEKIKQATVSVKCEYDKNYSPNLHTYIIEVDQLIEPQMRPRGGKYGTVYDPLKGYKKIFREKVLTEIKKNFISEPELGDIYFIKTKIILMTTPPESWSISKQYSALKEKSKFKTKPDIDNCVKTIYDSFEGIFFFNDSQIVKEILEKQYSTKEETIIEFRIYDQYESKGRLSKEDLDNMKPIYKEYLEKE